MLLCVELQPQVMRLAPGKETAKVLADLARMAQVVARIRRLVAIPVSRRHPESPQYGGYCAYAVAQGYTADIDPAAWSLVNGKLYLNYSHSVRERWKKDIPGYVRKGDANWPAVLQR